MSSGLPGGGPRHRGRLAAFHARRRPWMVWCAAAGVSGIAFLAVLPFSAVGGVGLGVLTFALLLVFPTTLVLGWTRRWHQRHDRTDDDVREYASGVTARLDLDEPMRGPHDPSGRLWLDGREVGRLDRGDDEQAEHPPTLTLSGTTLRLRARVDDDGVLTVRLSDTDGTTYTEAHGVRHRGLVDWTFPHEPDLRLRQHLATVPTRRTLLGADGRAWLVRADHVTNRRRAELPAGTTPRQAALVLWTCAHLDRIGVAHSYPRDRRRPGWIAPADAPFLLAPHGWRHVGGAVPRPEPPEPPPGTT